MIHQVASSFPQWAFGKVFPAVSGSTAVAAEVRRGRRHCRHFTVSKVSSSANIYPPTLPPNPPSRHPQGSKSISHYTDLKRLLSSFSSCRYHLRAASGFWILFIVFCHTKEKASETVVNVDVKVIWLTEPQTNGCAPTGLAAVHPLLQRNRGGKKEKEIPILPEIADICTEVGNTTAQLAHLESTDTTLSAATIRKVLLGTSRSSVTDQKRRREETLFFPLFLCFGHWRWRGRRKDCGERVVKQTDQKKWWVTECTLMIHWLFQVLLPFVTSSRLSS